MPHNRFFSSTPLHDTGVECAIDDLHELHHLQNVMKCRVGDEVEVIDGRGTLGKGIIVEIGKKKNARCLIRLSHIVRQELPHVAAFLALAMTRQNHLEFSLEKSTELGVAGFLLFPSDFSEAAGLSQERERRYRHIIRGAVKQSGRLVEPTCLLVPSLEKAIAMAVKPIYISDITPEARSVDSSVLSLSSATLFVGPERGWSETERTLFQELFPKQIVSLSDGTLRAETAAIIGCHELRRVLQISTPIQ